MQKYRLGWSAMRVALLFIFLFAQLCCSLSFLPNAYKLKVQKMTPVVYSTMYQKFKAANQQFAAVLGNKDRECNVTIRSHNRYKNGLLWWSGKVLEHRETIRTAIISFSLAVAVRMFVLEPRFIPTSSMFPTFKVGDKLLVDKISKWFKPFQRRDVVIFNPPEIYQSWTVNSHVLIKRIVAIAGDVVSVVNHRLLVNGVVQEESYIAEYPDYSLSEIVVPTGMVLVLGDNRNHSMDSHVWGFLPIKNIIGRAVLKYWPLARAGTIEGTTS